jgi:hypothetical protein
MDPIINFSDFVKHGKRIENPNSFKATKRLLVIGQPGTGKTNIVTQLVLNPVLRLKYSQIHIYAADLLDDKYVLIEKYFRKEEKRLSKIAGEPVKILHMADKLSDVIPLEEIDRTQQTLVIFDDFLAEAKSKDHKIVEDYWFRSRRLGCFCVYISQSFFGVPKGIRLATDYIILFAVNDDYDIDAIHKRFIRSMPLDVFKQTYKDNMAENDHGYIVISCIPSEKDQQIRLTFAYQTQPKIEN